MNATNTAKAASKTNTKTSTTITKPATVEDFKVLSAEAIAKLAEKDQLAYYRKYNEYLLAKKAREHKTREKTKKEFYAELLAGCTNATPLKTLVARVHQEERFKKSKESGSESSIRAYADFLVMMGVMEYSATNDSYRMLTKLNTGK